MNTEYVSLNRLAQSMGMYDSMPVPIQEGLKHSLALTAITNLVSIPVLILAPKVIQNIGFISPDGFFIWFTADLVNALLALSYYLSGFLLALNIASLLMVAVVMLVSRGITQPVHEPVHWLAWIAAFPSGASLISVGIIAGLFLATVFTTLVIWAILIVIGLVVTYILLMVVGMMSG